MKYQKRPFLLLEVLIGFSLLTIFAAPLFKEPFFLFKKEIHLLMHIEKRRLADLSFMEIKEKLYKNELKWNEDIVISPWEIQIDDSFHKIIEPYSEVSIKETENNDTLHRKLKVRIFSGETKKKMVPCYEVLLKKKQKKSS